MTYRRSYRAPLTPPAELVGQCVTWRPKLPNGQRAVAARGHVKSYDAATGSLVITVQQPVSMWQPNPERDVTVPLSSGPFTVI